MVANRATHELAAADVPVASRRDPPALGQLGLVRRRLFAPGVTAHPAGSPPAGPGMVHLDAYEVGRIPGWHAHTRGNDQAKQLERAEPTGLGGWYVYLALGYRWVLPAGLHQGFAGREGSHRHQLHSPDGAFFAAHRIGHIDLPVTDIQA